jgi:hypothetical protein
VAAEVQIIEMVRLSTDNLEGIDEGAKTAAK